MRWLLPLLLVNGLLGSVRPEAEPEIIECRGVIEAFDKGGFQGFAVEGECEILDITWVLVKDPEEFVGVRHMMLSPPTGDVSPYGSVGDTIHFSAYRSTLEGATRAKEKQAEQGAQRNAGDRPSSDAPQPSNIHPRPPRAADLGVRQSMSSPGSSAKIATSSVEEGLDFACSLISDAIAEAGRTRPEKAAQLLQELASYVQFRYVGELGLALEYLAGLGATCVADSPRGIQFWCQLQWVADKMALTSEAKKKLGFPHEKRA